jgi:iron complex outermembrane recepter protein
MYNNARILVVILTAGLGALAALGPAAAVAQTGGDNPAAGAASITAGGAVASAAASASGSNGGLEEVVVTARRRTEQLQDVPLTVTAVTAESIQDYNVQNLADLTSFVPNMKISQDRATSSTINVYIRGVGQSDPLWGFQPGVGVYVDDVYLARPQAALLDVLDVDRLEVLSGPQGTLYGRNTIAGAIKYVTRDIAGPATLTASATGGNYDTRNFKFMGSLPVIPDHVYFGLSLASLRHDGYGEVVAQPDVAVQPPQSPLGVALSNKDILVGRANLTITWGESSKLKLVADDILDNSNASGGQRLNDYLNGEVSVLSLPLLGIPALPFVTPNAPPLSNPFDMYDNMPADRDFFHRQGFSGTYTQNLTSELSLKLVGAYYEGHGEQFINFSQTAQNLFDVAGQYHDQQSSGEMQLSFTNDLVKAVGGVFYMDSNACGVYNADIGTLPLLGIPALDTYITELVSGCDLTKSTAVYGDTSWKLTDQLNLDAGLRWTEDKITAQVFQEDYVGPPVEPGMIFGTPEQAPPGLISTGVVTDYTGERSFTHLDPRLGFDYHFTKNVMGYFTYSRGFKSGGFDMRGNAVLTPSTTEGYDAEVANNYELGLKSTLLDNTLLLNLAVFYDPYTDAQIQLGEVTINSAGLPANVTYTTNAGKQINQGAELQTVWRPIRPLTVALNVGYLDSYYEHYVVPCDIFPHSPQITPGCTPGVASVDLSSSQSPLNAPHWTVSEYQSYTWDFAAGSLMARAGVDYRSYAKTATTINAWTATDQPGYAVVNAGLAFMSNDGHWRVSLDGRNLANKYYRVAGYEFGPPPLASAPLYSFVGGVSEIGYYGPPRTWELTLQYHF